MVASGSPGTERCGRGIASRAPLWLCFAASRDARAARIRRPLAAVAVPGGRCNWPAILLIRVAVA